MHFLPQLISMILADPTAAEGELIPLWWLREFSKGGYYLNCKHALHQLHFIHSDQDDLPRLQAHTGRETYTLTQNQHPLNCHFQTFALAGKEFNNRSLIITAWGCICRGGKTSDNLTVTQWGFIEWSSTDAHRLARRPFEGSWGRENAVTHLSTYTAFKPVWFKTTLKKFCNLLADTAWG